jgi:hypothetical protein
MLGGGKYWLGNLLKNATAGWRESRVIRLLLSPKLGVMAILGWADLRLALEPSMVYVLATYSWALLVRGSRRL